MARTNVRGGQILDGSIQRQDMDVVTVGQAVLVKVIAGAGISIVSTGGDAGTGDATITATAGSSDIALTMMTSNSDETITAGYSAVVADWYEISAGNTLEIGAASVMELT